MQVMVDSMNLQGEFIYSFPYKVLRLHTNSFIHQTKGMILIGRWVQSSFNVLKILEASTDAFNLHLPSVELPLVKIYTNFIIK